MPSFLCITYLCTPTSSTQLYYIIYMSQYLEYEWNWCQIRTQNWTSKKINEIFFPTIFVLNNNVNCDLQYPSIELLNKKIFLKLKTQFFFAMETIRNFLNSNFIKNAILFSGQRYRLGYSVNSLMAEILIVICLTAIMP